MAFGITAPRGFEEVKALAKATCRSIETLLALGRHNDPFFAGSEAQRRDAEWFAEWWHRLGFHERRNVHLRGVHYRLVSRPEGEVVRPDGRPYENTKECWKWLADASAPARHLRLVDPDAFIDRKNHGLALHPGHADRLAGRPTEGRWWVDVPGEWWSLPEIETDPAWDLNFRLPTPQVGGYDYSLGDQSYVLEVWIEKSTMNDVLQPVCDEFGLNLVYSTGFQSITNARNLLKRVHQLGLPGRILYISDFDPAGDVMPTAVARQVEFWFNELAPGADVKLTPLALTRDQVAHYRLPRTPIKEEDLRRAGFEEVYGKGAAELDALEELYPGVLAGLLRDAVAPYVDQTLSRRLTETAAEAQRALEDAWDEATAPYLPELRAIEAQGRATAAKYRAELERLNDALQEELAPLNDRLEVVRDAIRDAVDDVDIELPARPEPEIDPPDEDDWLFDAGRDYLEQLAYYKGRRGEEVDEVIVYTDGLTTSQRQTLTAIREAGGAMTTKAMMVALGIKAWPAGQRRINELAALGLVEPVGKGTKNDPRVWRLTEPGGDQTQEAAGG